jgi:multisubunit Na+/H+ antiporter MnhC subunit
MLTISIAAVALVGFVLFFFVLKRLLRMAFQLAVVGAVILVALLMFALMSWWYSPPSATNQNKGTPARATRPAR